MADNEMNLILRLKDEFSKVAEKATSGLNGLKDNFSKLATAGNLLAGGAIATIAKGLGSLVDAFGESESATIKLKAALEATGQEVEVNSKSMLDYASQLESMTTISDDAAVGLMQIAVSMGLTADQAKMAAQQAVGLASAYGVDLNAGIKMAAAAQEGNYDLLKRTIPELRNIKDETELAARAQQLLGAAFKQAQADTQTYQGAMKQLGNQINNAQEALGQALAPAFILVAKAIGSIVGWFNNLTPSTKEATGVLLGITGVVSALAIAFTILTWPILATAAAIAAVVAGFILLKEATAPLAEKTAQLTKEHDNLQNKLRETNEQLKELEKQGLQNSSQYLKLQNDLEETNKKLTDNEQKIRNNIKALEDQRLAIEEKIAAQKKDVEEASGDKKIKELEELESLEAQKREILAASKDAETELLLQKNEEQNTALNDQKTAQEEARAAYDEEMKAADYETQIAEREALIAQREAWYQEDLAKLGDNETAKAQLTAKYNVVRAADDKKVQDLQGKQKEEQSKQFANWENFMLGATKSKNKEVAAIAKALAIKNIIFETGKAAMGAYSSMASIPFVGPVLGAAAAAAAIAFGAEQVQSIQSQGVEMAEGGIIPATPGGVQVTAAEAGKDEAFIPLDDDEAVSRLGGGDTTLHIYIDGVEVAASVVKGYNKGRNLNMVGKLTEA